MRAIRIAPLAALGALLAACAEGRLTEAGAPTAPVYARVAVDARVPAQVAAQARTLVVVATYARAAAPSVLLPLDSTAASIVSGAAADVPVQINLTACLADAARESAATTAGGAPVCLMHLALLLLDASGKGIAAAQVVVPAGAGATVTSPTVTFTTLAVGAARALR